MDIGETDAGEPEQLPIKMQGCWPKCKVRDAHILALEKEGTMAPRVESVVVLSTDLPWVQVYGGLWKGVNTAIWDGGSMSLPNFKSRNGGETLRAAIIHYMATSARLQ
jgi:hypothetical protein